MKTLNELFRLVILANELDNNEKAALRFSDPDGVLSGKSGWSFGVCQFDTRNNGESLKCLADCGLTQDEIHGIVDQTIDVKPLALNLISHKDTVAKYDEAQLSHCLDSAVNFNNAHCIPVTDTAALLAQADYVNQYGSMGDGFAAYLKGINRPVEAHDILTFKIEHTKYGKEHPKDCQRRYDNLMKVVQNA